MVELRKRKAPPAEPAAPPPLKKSVSSSSKANAVKATKAAVPEKKAAPANGASSDVKIAIGSEIPLDNFGGEVETHDGEKTTLEKLLKDSKNGVVLFTYPKASTPGCTTQACLFRDSYDSLTSTGYSIFGLSTDSPKANATFRTKKNLPYTLLCDPAAKLIAAIGMKKAPRGTTRGVLVISKQAKIELTFAGGPAATVDEVRKLFEEQAANTTEASKDLVEGNKDKKEGEGSESKTKEPRLPKRSKVNKDAANAEVVAEVAAEVADSAEKLDQED